MDKEDGLWQKIVKYKYLKKNTISNVKHKQSDSPIWADLLEVRNIYVQGRNFVVGNGKEILFWYDNWLYDQPLNVLFLDLFKMTQQPNITVAQALIILLD